MLLTSVQGTQKSYPGKKFASSMLDLENKVRFCPFCCGKLDGYTTDALRGLVYLAPDYKKIIFLIT